MLPRQPLKPLEPKEYQFALAERINRMVAKELPNRAKALLEKAAQFENLHVLDNLKAAGDLLVENSDWLRSRAVFPSSPVPVPLKNDPQGIEALKGDDLETYLSLLYHVSE